MRVYTRKVITVGDLRERLANKGLDDDAFVWVCTAGRQYLVASLDVDFVSTPNKTEESALLLFADDIG